MITTEAGRPVEDGGRPSPTRGWIAPATLVGVSAVGAAGALDPVLLASLLPGGT